MEFPVKNSDNDSNEIRQEIRNRLLTNALLNNDEELTIEGSFDGYGDSGTVTINHDERQVCEFLEEMVENNCHFDWYNNEGGGGDITWHLKSDKIIINGYYNVTEAVTAMDEEEF